MAVALTSPITGSPQTGFTSPTYTIVSDSAPDVNGKQYAVTALGGTQAGVSYHSGSNPFTLMFAKPKVYKPLGKANPVTGLIANVPMNTYKFNTRKGMIPLAGQPAKTGIVRTDIDIPSGADLAATAEIRAMISAHIGALTQFSAGLGDTLVTNVM